MKAPEPAVPFYLKLCLHVDGGENLYLIVPTVWDDVQKMWGGFIKTPKLKKLIQGEGKDSFDLQISFNKAAHAVTQNSEEAKEDFLSMFHPLSYWEEGEVKNKKKRKK